MTRNQLASITPDADGFARINGVEVTFTDEAGTSLTSEGRAMLSHSAPADKRDPYLQMLDDLHR